MALPASSCGLRARTADQAKVTKDDYSGGQRVVAERLLDLTAARQEFGKRVRVTVIAEVRTISPQR